MVVPHLNLKSSVTSTSTRSAFGALLATFFSHHEIPFGPTQVDSIIYFFFLLFGWRKTEDYIKHYKSRREIEKINFHDGEVNLFSLRKQGKGGLGQKKDHLRGIKEKKKSSLQYMQTSLQKERKKNKKHFNGPIFTKTK